VFSFRGEPGPVLELVDVELAFEIGYAQLQARLGFSNGLVVNGWPNLLEEEVE
jgi:hypothetical protein